MGVYIKGMEMPTSCRACPLATRFFDGEDVCAMLGTYVHDRDREDDCPLVHVPPHGDLIDRDALMHEFEKAERTMEQHGREYSCSFLSSSQEISTEWYCVEDILENAPTVITADTAEEGE